MSPPAQRESAPESQAVELAFWDTVKESDDPKMFEAYLAKYPEGSSLAWLRSSCSRLGAPAAQASKAAPSVLRSRLGCCHCAQSLKLSPITLQIFAAWTSASPLLGLGHGLLDATVGRWDVKVACVMQTVVPFGVVAIST